MWNWIITFFVYFLIIVIILVLLLLLLLGPLHGNQSSTKIRTFIILLTNAWFYHIEDDQWIFPKQINTYPIRFVYQMALPGWFLLEVSNVIEGRWWFGQSISKPSSLTYVAVDCLDFSGWLCYKSNFSNRTIFQTIQTAWNVAGHLGGDPVIELEPKSHLPGVWSQLHSISTQSIRALSK